MTIMLPSFFGFLGGAEEPAIPEILGSDTFTNTTNSITLPAGTDALVVLIINDESDEPSSVTYNGDALAKAVAATETGVNASIWHRFNPDTGSSYTINVGVSAAFVIWYAVAGISGLLDTDADDAGVDPQNITLDISGGAYTGFICSANYFTTNSIEVSDADWSEDFDDASLSRLCYATHYIGSGSASKSTSVSCASTGRFISVGASYQ